ncbi:hypothetical protein Tco_0037699 [Tanacetum coccineum]
MIADSTLDCKRTRDVAGISILAKRDSIYEESVQGKPPHNTLTSGGIDFYPSSSMSKVGQKDIIAVNPINEHSLNGLNEYVVFRPKDPLSHKSSSIDIIILDDVPQNTLTAVHTNTEARFQ